MMLNESYSERDRQTETEKERKRQRHTQRDTHRDREMEADTERERKRQRQRERGRERHIHTHRQGKRGRHRERQADREGDTETEEGKATEKETHRQTDRQTDRQTERDIRKSGETGLVDGDGLAGGVQLHPGRVFRRVLHDTNIACGVQTNKTTLNTVYSYTTLHLSRHASYQKKQLQPQRLFCNPKCLKWVYPLVAHTGRFTPGLQVSRWGGGGGGWEANMCFR